MATYLIVEGPRHVEAPDSTLLTGYYEAVFEDEAGRRHTRYLTDKGRAGVLRRQDAEGSFSQEDFERWTVDPDIGSVLARYGAEAGEGA